MKSKGITILAILLIVGMLSSSYAFAFSDVDKSENGTKITSLQSKGFLSGVSKHQFNPNGTMDNAQAISLIVKALELNIDNIRFIQAPKASHYFTKVPDKAWYASSFIVAFHNGLNLPKTIDPKQQITREQFAYYLSNALQSKGNYPMIQLYMILNDEKEVTKDYMNAIQNLLITKIASLDAKQNFRPKAVITRAEAAVMVYNTIEFIATHKEDVNPLPNEPTWPDSTIKLTTEKVSDQINKVILTGQVPNPGYNLTVKNIEFRDNQAIISYALVPPDPDKSYIQVITDAKVETYISSRYTAVLKHNSSTSSGMIAPAPQVLPQ